MHDAVADRHPSGLDATVIERAVDRIGDIAVADAPLAPLTTYKVGGSAAVFAEVTSVDDLLRVGRELELACDPPDAQQIVDARDHGEDRGRTTDLVGGQRSERSVGDGDV
ncbi:MAG: hypothetical protein AAGG08_18495, partial [Actinomycetota bacterium]